MTPARPSLPPRLLACSLMLMRLTPGASPLACSGSPVTGTDADDSDATGASTSASSAATDDAPTTTATPTGPAGACGDGHVDPGEACDDGNALDNDTCTSKCQAPSCTDGARTGNETDLDCGGDCGPCPDDAVCFGDGDCESGLCSGKCVGLYPSCYQLHLYFPSLQDGDYGIDPDGDGTPTTFHCLMLDGGWTEVGRDDFTAPTGWSAGTPGSCGTLSDHLLGGAGQFGTGAATERTFPLQGVAHKEVRVVADVIIIDSWETESMIAEIDGQSVASAVCSQGIAGSCGAKDSQCGAPQYKDGLLHLIGMRELPADSATIRFSSTLDQPADDEAWGLASVSVQVR